MPELVKEKETLATTKVSIPRIAKKPKVVNRFQFDSETHSYLLDGKPLTGVTTILGVIAKPALIAWAAKETVKYLDNNKPKTVEIAGVKVIPYTPDQFHDALDKAKAAHRAKKDSTADIGTKIHAWLEKFVKGKNPKRQAKIGVVTDNFVKWANENQVKFISSELRVYSEKYWYAGTLDLILEMNGKKYVADIKTTSGIYDRTPFFQMAGYQIALEEYGMKGIDGRIIIRCGKDGAFEVKESLDYETDKKGFLACLELYRALKTY
jgi:hypothetical protein